MEDTNDSRDEFSLGPDMGGKWEEEDDEFRSCCGEHEEWRDPDEMGIEGLQSDVDEFSLKMFFKGVSVSGDGDPGLRISGIGVVMEGSNGMPIVEVQKKLDFYVEDPMVDYLALMDGLLEAPMDGIRRIFAYTDSKILCDQIAEPDGIEDQLLAAFIQRIIEHTSKLESFVLKFIPSCDLKRPLQLAREAVGCGHEFCYNCGEEYIDDEEDRDSEQSILHSNQDSEPWNWNAFDAYTDQERSQLALLQRFLAGGFGLGDHHHPCQSPPHCSDSYMETIKDLHQLPWLERFISVISDNYHEDYIR
ncbi:hypothetical protein QJS10_CPB11g01471 [Acorus calamus]|uniref:RNase H type-1 domain-containing protein n=1 Tax=Acorus calamus TaxID=4465 RepID=A0AAV9DTZ7_ACOCL|nr:hypothetical protein QJS10_CPB11g01471 [Acorus calamus]